MKIKISILIFFLYLSLLQAIIPLPDAPTWTSVDTNYSTGGALYDINMDGWIDYCTGNGNDMASNRNGIYYNNNGTLETNASWRSTESGYFSHLYIGDVNNDSFPDMAVSYLGFGTNQGPTHIYRNTGAGLQTTAWWTSTDHYNSFDCAFGDFDLDADLDLAVAAGDVYNNIRSPVRVYRNNSGAIETTPFWTSIDSTPSNACRWIDIDNDGFLDLIVGYRKKIAIYKNTNGNLNPAPYWSATVPGWVLRIAIGDYNNDGYKDFAIACNGQLSGDTSCVMIYRNNTGIPQTPPAYTLLTNTQHCSCVEWGDPNNDTWLDLAAGGWWEPVVVFENINGMFNTTPAWLWNGGYNLVCETVMWNDVDKSSVVTITEYRSGDGSRKLFYLNRNPIQGFKGIKINDIPVALSDYTYDPLSGWISLKNAPPAGTNNIEITYQYAHYADLGVTNWTPNVGNYLFANTTSGIEEQIAQTPSQKIDLIVYPNPFTTKLNIRYEIPDTRYEITNEHISHITYLPSVSLKIYDATGRLVRQFNHLTANQRGGIQPFNQVVWSGTDDFGRKLPNGVYIIEAELGKTKVQQKVVLCR